MFGKYMTHKIYNIYASSPLLQRLVFITSILTIIFLGLFRIKTDAQYAFLTLAIFPIIATTWFVNRTSGWLTATLAAGILGYSDYTSTLLTGYTAFLNTAIRLSSYLILVETIQKLKQHIQKELLKGRTDKLTGILNRRGFTEVVDLQIHSANRMNIPVAVAFIDLDQFKLLNDNRGHKAGDLALKAVGKTLRESLRSNDICARLGGDEFCILSFEKDKDSAEKWAQRMHIKLTETLLEFPPVTASIGVALFHPPTLQVTKMLNLADAVMYEVKNTTKNAVLVRSF